VLYEGDPKQFMDLCRTSIRQYFPENPDVQQHGFSWSHTPVLDTTHYSLSLNAVVCTALPAPHPPLMALLLCTSGTQLDALGRWGMSLVDIINEHSASAGVQILHVRTQDLKITDWPASQDSTDALHTSLEQLKKLHDDGLITDQEYATKKQALLDQMK